MKLRRPCPSSPSGVARDKGPLTAADYMAAPVSELIRACVDNDAAAWREFIRRFHRIIVATAWRVARRWGESSPTLVDDLAQDTYLKLCAEGARVLGEFDSPHPDGIFAFLKVVTANVANDHFKHLRARKRGGGHVDRPLEDAERTASAGPASPASVERALLLDAVNASLCAVAPAETRERDKAIFWLYYRHGLTAKEIVDLPFGLSLKGVESTLHRLTQLVRTHLVESRGGKSCRREKALAPSGTDDKRGVLLKRSSTGQI